MYEYPDWMYVVAVLFFSIWLAAEILSNYKHYKMTLEEHNKRMEEHLLLIEKLSKL